MTQEHDMLSDAWLGCWERRVQYQSLFLQLTESKLSFIFQRNRHLEFCSTRLVKFCDCTPEGILCALTEGQHGEWDMMHFLKNHQHDDNCVTASPGLQQSSFCTSLSLVNVPEVLMGCDVKYNTQ